MRNFTDSEFPEPLEHASADLLEFLDDFRDFLGVAIVPSLASGALARFSGPPKSRHFAKGRQSTAIDVFIDAPAPWVFLRAGMYGWGGIGVYFDTKNNQGEPQTMFHLDLRAANTVWFRENGMYVWPKLDRKGAERMMQLLGNAR